MKGKSSSRGTEAGFLEWFKEASRTVNTPSNPSRRQTRTHVERRASHRHQSARMRAVGGFTPNLRKAGLQSAEEAERPWQYVKPADPRVLTRNVGPSDLDPNYTSGKNTGSERHY